MAWRHSRAMSLSEDFLCLVPLVGERCELFSGLGKVLGELLAARGGLGRGGIGLVLLGLSASLGLLGAGVGGGGAGSLGCVAGDRFELRFDGFGVGQGA